MFIINFYSLNDKKKIEWHEEKSVLFHHLHLFRMDLFRWLWLTLNDFLLHLTLFEDLDLSQDIRNGYFHKEQ
jgi:hypothetical protein